MTSAGPKRRKMPMPWRLAALAAMATVASLATFLLPQLERGSSVDAAQGKQDEADNGKFRPTANQWRALTIEPVKLHTFRGEYLTEGKIAVDEDRSTPIFSPYAGRITRLLVAPGDRVQPGQPLFVLEATDTVQAQNDFFAALTSVNKARAQVQLAETVEHRLHNLYEAKAMPLKDWQEAQANLTGAQNDLRTAQTALEAMRNRLRMLGKSDEEISKFESSGTITADSLVRAPLAGTIVQRKVGPGQYITTGSSDPAFVIGDLSTVWLVALVREAEASKVKVGQVITFSVLAYPDRMFEARINYVSASLDPSTRRLTVRATVDNTQSLLKPEMFASVKIVVGDATGPSIAVPRDAIIYDGNSARVWLATDNQTLEVREIKVGLSSGSLVQVTEGLRSSDKLITKGSLFIDRAAGSS